MLLYGNMVDEWLVSTHTSHFWSLRFESWSSCVESYESVCFSACFCDSVQFSSMRLTCVHLWISPASDQCVVLLPLDWSRLFPKNLMQLFLEIESAPVSSNTAWLSQRSHLLKKDWNVAQCGPRAVELSPFGAALDPRCGPCESSSVWINQHNDQRQGSLNLPNLPLVWTPIGPSINLEAASESKWMNPC